MTCISLSGKCFHIKQNTYLPKLIATHHTIQTNHMVAKLLVPNPGHHAQGPLTTLA